MQGDAPLVTHLSQGLTPTLAPWAPTAPSFPGFLCWGEVTLLGGSISAGGQHLCWGCSISAGGSISAWPGFGGRGQETLGIGNSCEDCMVLPRALLQNNQNHGGLYVDFYTVMENGDVGAYSLPWKDAYSNPGKERGRAWNKSYFLQNVGNFKLLPDEGAHQ